MPSMPNGREHSSAVAAATDERLTPVPEDNPSLWHASDFQEVSSYAHQLTEAETAELRAAVQHIGAVKSIETITKSDFELPLLAPVLVDIQRQVVFGRGWALLKGLPVHTWSTRESAIAYWLLSLHIGVPLPQNKHGHLLGHVRDHGNDPNDPKTRIYATSLAQPYHVDRAADVVGLLCLTTAKEGGASSWCSSPAVYNEVLRRRPDLAQVLAQPFHLDRKGEVPAGKQQTYQCPVFTFSPDGQLSINYSRPFLETASRHKDVPALSDEQVVVPCPFRGVGLYDEHVTCVDTAGMQFLVFNKFHPLLREALDLVEATAGSSQLRLDYNLESGDIQLINNFTILHARTAFTDHAEQDRKRHLFRMWLCPPIGRPLAPEWAEQYGSTEIGERGGIRVPGIEPWVDLRGDR